MKITLNELRQLVKNIINEQNIKTWSPALDTTFWKSSTQTPTNLYGVYKITKESFMPNGTISIETTNPSVKFMFICSNKALYLQGNKTQVYNQGYISGLVERYCNNINKIFPSNNPTTSAGAGTAPKNSLQASANKVAELIQRVRFYNNPQEVSNDYDLVLNISQTYTDKNATQVILETNKGNYSFKCTMDKSGNHYISAIKDGLLPSPLMYNKSYIAKLKAVYCTKSAGGSDVISVGLHSQIDQKTPMNVAESKLRSLIKSIINENDCGCSK